MKEMVKKHAENIEFVFAILTAISFVIFAVGVCIYGDWIKTVKLYNAGLIREFHLEWDRITRYEPAIRTMRGGLTCGLLNLAAFIAVKIIKNGKKA